MGIRGLLYVLPDPIGKIVVWWYFAPFGHLGPYSILVFRFYFLSHRRLRPVWVPGVVLWGVTTIWCRLGS
jgi:hypothetical protein